MAKMKAKASVGGESRGKLLRGSPRGRTSSGRGLPWVRRLILLGIIVALLFWQWPTITSWASNTWGGTVKLFGWGLLIIAIAVGVLVGLIVARKLSSLVYHWNRWLGGIAFVLAVWGILALPFFRLGGSVGRSIIDFWAPDYVGILRIVGLVIIGAVLVAPGAFLRFLKSINAWRGKEFQRREAPEPTAGEHQPPLPPSTYSIPASPPPAEKVVPPPVKPVAVPLESPKGDLETETAIPVITPTPAQQELKQVAQEVWKKYGESSAVTIVDGWRLPPIDILDVSPEVEFGQADNMQRAALIEEALASYGVEAKVVQINAGPTVTQFGVEPGWDRRMKEIREKDKDGNTTVRLKEVSETRVKVERITSLTNNLALALAASSIRI